ncbi:terminase [Citrobacter cronae]|uniref:phage terminase small subunit n=1 Tax=Citrobacter cronae TaxID=1748967 RepID=UPI0021CFEE9A|nr:phage terminase small subunit [Citrobacter cronae]MCU6182654.1 terminase [Citrobacter cronae]
MLTPAQKHFQKVMADRRGDSAAQQSVVRTAHEQILHRLRLDQTSLKAVQSTETKAVMKRDMLPNYQGWIDGTLEGDSGRQDEVITTLMLWAIDCQDYPQALKIGRYVVKHGLSMRDDFKRTAPVLLAEEISNQVLNIATADAGADLSGYVALLDEVAEIVEGCDMPDEVASKLCKARGFSRRGSSDNETKGEALKLFRRATELNPNAGVKREMQALTRDLKKLAASQPDAVQAEKKPAKTATVPRAASKAKKPAGKAAKAKKES